MSLVAQVLVVVTGLVHVWAGTLESFLFHRPGVHAKVFHARSGDVRVLRFWTFNQGFYNFFLAAGAFLGVVLVRTGNVTAGRTLALYVCGFMFLCGVVLVVSNRRHLDGALGQSLPALAGLVATLAS